MDNFRISTLEYKRPDLEAHRAKLTEWKAAAEQAESYDALRALMLKIDRENCELSHAVFHREHPPYAEHP